MGIKYPVNEKFFDTWTSEMAYVLGFLFADGSLENAPYVRGKYVRVTSTDEDRVQVIKKLLNSSHTIVKTEKGGNRKPRYLLRIGSRSLYERLVILGVTPRKSFTMTFPHVPPECLSGFVRGYFDGDGCVNISHNYQGKSRLFTIFTSGSRAFLESLHCRLQATANVTGSTLHSHASTPGTFQLRYFARDSIRLFELMYPVGIPHDLLMQRKYAIFMRYFDEIQAQPLRRMSKYIPTGHMAK